MMVYFHSDNDANHVANMGNSLLTPAELEDEEVKAYLSLYDYVIPVVAVFIVFINLSVVISSGLLIKKRKSNRCWW